MSKTMIIIVLVLSTAVLLYLCFLSIKLIRAAQKQAQADKVQASLQQQATDAKALEQKGKARRKK